MPVLLQQPGDPLRPRPIRLRVGHEEVPPRPLPGALGHPPTFSSRLRPPAPAMIFAACPQKLILDSPASSVVWPCAQYGATPTSAVLVRCPRGEEPGTAPAVDERATFRVRRASKIWGARESVERPQDRQDLPGDQSGCLIAAPDRVASGGGG